MGTPNVREMIGKKSMDIRSPPRKHQDINLVPDTPIGTCFYRLEGGGSIPVTPRLLFRLRKCVKLVLDIIRCYELKLGHGSSSVGNLLSHIVNEDLYRMKGMEELLQQVHWAVTGPWSHGIGVAMSLAMARIAIPDGIQSVN